MSVRTILGYDIVDGVSEEDYEHWLFDIHVPDILANPHVDRLSFNKVLGPVGRASDGSATSDGQLTFYRIAEMEFADMEAYQAYLKWFEAHPVPPSRGPAGRTAFRFYLITDSVVSDRNGYLPPSFLDLQGES